MYASVPDAGRVIRTSGARIAGLVSCVPSREVGNDYFLERFGASDVASVVKMIGVNRRRWVDDVTTTRDLCKAAGSCLLEALEWDASSVDALIFVSQTPDYRLPATACVLQADLGLSSSCLAFDVNLGCSGYPYALWLGMTMIQTGAASRVLLAVGDTISKIVSMEDRATAMLFGDAGTVTGLEASAANEVAHFVLGTDGRGANNLMVSAGAFKQPHSSGASALAGKDPACLYMDGGEIFNFTLRAVPPLVASTLDAAGKGVEEHDGFLFHQANKFMINHLSKKASLHSDKVPINIDQFGNTSSASIPLLMTTKLSDALAQRRLRLAMFGFGVGYSWGGVSLQVGPLRISKTIEL